jgi:hypothetical protein
MTIKNNDAASSPPAEEEIVVDAPIAVAQAIPVTTNYAVPDTTNYAASAVDTNYAASVPSSKGEREREREPPATTSTTTTTTTIPAPAQAGTSHPPPGIPDGGYWGTANVIGPATWTTCAVVSCVCCFLTLLPCGLFALLCPCDRGDVYAVSGRVYDRGGKYMGPASRFNMAPLAHGR